MAMIESPHLPDEEQVGKLVRTSLQAVTRPDDGRLRQLMPPPPTRGQRLWAAWQRPLATLCTMLIFGIALWGLARGPQPAAWSPAGVTAVAVTATFTTHPTATETEPTAGATSTAVHPGTKISATPVPPATPLAALPLLASPMP